MRNILSTQIVSEPEIRTSSELKMSHPAFVPPCGFGRLLPAIAAKIIARTPFLKSLRL